MTGVEPTRLKKCQWFFISRWESIQHGIREYTAYLNKLDAQFAMLYPQTPAQKWKQKNTPRWGRPHKMPRKVRRVYLEEMNA